jgi:hypothetical protein
VPAHVEYELFFRPDGTSFPVEYWVNPILRDGERHGAPWLDIDVSNAEILDMPVEFGLEFMAAIGADHLDPKRELLDDVIDEVDRICLIVLVVDFQGPDAGGVIDGCIGSA